MTRKTSSLRPRAPLDTRRSVRRAMDVGTGCVLAGFGTALALEHT